MRNALLGLSVMGSALWAAPTAAQQNPGAELGRIVPYSEEELREREHRRPDASQTADEILRNAETFRQQMEKEAAGLRGMAASLPLVPTANNPLIGKWVVDIAMRASGNDAHDLISSGACRLLFSDGVVNFRAEDWSLDDSAGNESLGEVSYRGRGALVFVIPAQGINMLAFAVQGPNKLVELRNSSDQEECTLSRVPMATTYATRPRASRPPSVAAPEAGQNRAAAANAAAAQARANAPPGQDKYTAPANPSSAVGARMRASIDPSSLLGQGIALRNNLEMYKAMVKLEEAAKATPNDAKVHIYLADTYYRLSKQAEGKAEEARALQLDPNVMEIFK